MDMFIFDYTDDNNITKNGLSILANNYTFNNLTVIVMRNYYNISKDQNNIGSNGAKMIGKIKLPKI